MEFDSIKDSQSDQCENMEFHEKKNPVEFIPLDGKLDAVTSEPSTTTPPILESKRNSGKSIKISFNFSRPRFLNPTESSTQLSGSKPGVAAPRRINAEKQEDHQKTTQSTNKTPTPIWRNRIQASSPCKTSQESTKKAQPQNSSNSTSQVQAQKIKTQSTSTPLISSPQKEQKEKTKNQPSISSLVQRTFRVISSAKPSSSTVKKAPCQKDSSPQKVWKEKILKQQALESSTAVQRRTLQVNSSSKRPPTVTNKNPHFQKDSSSSSQKETKKQTSTRGPEKAKESASATPVYYIRWDGSERTREEPVTEYCPLCEEELSSSLRDRVPAVYYNDIYEYEDEDDDLEARILPEVSVLGCGHVFHSKCLDRIGNEDQTTDPICFLCLSKCS